MEALKSGINFGKLKSNKLSTKERLLRKMPVYQKAKQRANLYTSDRIVKKCKINTEYNGRGCLLDYSEVKYEHDCINRENQVMTQILNQQFGMKFNFSVDIYPGVDGYTEDYITCHLSAKW